MRALVVDDDFVSRSVLARFLLPLGQVDLAADGQQGLDLFTQAHADSKPYDLVALDIMMPRLDGHATLTALRQHERQLGVPAERRARVLITAALDDVRSITAAFRELCDDYILKPIRRPVLCEKLAEFGFPLPV